MVVVVPGGEHAAQRRLAGSASASRDAAHPHAPRAPTPGSLAFDTTVPVQGARTVPRIFVDGQFIGGADDVAALDASGELEALLKQKGLLATH